MHHKPFDVCAPPVPAVGAYSASSEPLAGLRGGPSFEEEGGRCRKEGKWEVGKGKRGGMWDGEGKRDKG